MWNPENFGWPEHIMIALMALTLIAYFFMHGKPRKNYNFYEGFFNFAVTAYLLYFGGFFS